MKNTGAKTIYISHKLYLIKVFEILIEYLLILNVSCVLGHAKMNKRGLFLPIYYGKTETPSNS